MAIIHGKLVVISILMTGVIFLNGNKCFQAGCSKIIHCRCKRFTICKQQLKETSNIIEGGAMDLIVFCSKVVRRENISKLRVARGLTQENLGKQIGLTSSAISNIENATSYPSVDTLIRFASFFSVTMDYLLTDTDVKQLEELHLKSKLLTAEMFLKSGQPQKGSYEIDNKKYFFEERQNEITYTVLEINK